MDHVALCRETRQRVLGDRRQALRLAGRRGRHVNPSVLRFIVSLFRVGERQQPDLRDVRAGQEMYANWLIVNSSVTAESMFMNYNYSPGHFNGWACNLTLWDRFGKPYKAWPVGTITAEGGNGWRKDGGGNPSIGYPVSGSGASTGRLLYCANDQVWRYVNP